MKLTERHEYIYTTWQSHVYCNESFANKTRNSSHSLESNGNGRDGQFEFQQLSGCIGQVEELALSRRTYGIFICNFVVLAMLLFCTVCTAFARLHRPSIYLICSSCPSFIPLSNHLLRPFSFRASHSICRGCLRTVVSLVGF